MAGFICTCPLSSRGQLGNRKDEMSMLVLFEVLYICISRSFHMDMEKCIFVVRGQVHQGVDVTKAISFNSPEVNRLRQTSMEMRLENCWRQPLNMQ